MARYNYMGSHASVILIPRGMPGVADTIIRAHSWDLRADTGHEAHAFSYSGVTLKVEGMLERESTNKALTDAQRLAYAVLHEDPAAALLLADEVQLRHLHPQDFVPRADLEARIRELEERNADLERELNIRKASGRAGGGGVW